MTTPDFSRPVLAIDTSTAFLSLALHAGGQWHGMHTEAGNRQSDLILPGIRSLLSEAACTVSDLGAIVYAQGAGAFTGLRIGIGVAQGLAVPFGIPLVGIPCLWPTRYPTANACWPPPTRVWAKCFMRGSIRAATSV